MLALTRALKAHGFGAGAAVRTAVRVPGSHYCVEAIAVSGAQCFISLFQMNPAGRLPGASHALEGTEPPA